MIVFVLHHAGMEARHLALHRPAVAIDPAIADARRARHRGAQAGDRQAALPAQHALLAQQLDLRVDHHRVADRRVVGVLVAARLGDAEHEQPQRHMHLRRGQAGAGGVLHRLHHVGDQAADLRCAGVRHRLTLLQQHGVAHARYLQNGHVSLRRFDA